MKALLKYESKAYGLDQLKNIEESLFLLIISVIIGLFLFYLSIILLNPLLQQSFGLIIELSAPTALQWLLLGGIILAGLIFTLIPAFQTYKNSLQDGLSQRT